MLLKNTRYGKVLSSLPTLSDGRISLPETEALLFTRYYERLFAQIRRDPAAQELLSLHGRRLDLKNLSRLLRMRGSFDVEPSYAERCVIRQYYKLKPASLAELARCPVSELDVRLSSTRYGREMKLSGETDFETYAKDAQTSLCRRLIAVGSSPAAVVTAYLELKQTEVAAIISATEKVRYKTAAVVRPRGSSPTL